MEIIGITLIGKKYPCHFGVLVDEPMYSSYIGYIRENYPNVGCCDTNMPQVLRETIRSGIDAFLQDSPYYKDTEAILSDIDSLKQISIQNDSIVSTEERGLLFVEIHEGIVSYCNELFTFSHKVTYSSSDKTYIKTSLAINYDVYLLPDKKYFGRGIGLANACQEALKSKNRATEREKYEAAFKVWADYYRSNKDAFNRWFFPILDSPRACQKCRTFIKWSVITKFNIMSLERGICPFCASHCRLASNSLEDGEHAKQWYELRLEEVNCPNRDDFDF